MTYKLPALPYPYDALEPYIDAKTMKIHHSKHHRGYTDKLNAAINGTAVEDYSLEEIFRSISGLSDAIRNNGGGHYNHSLFWSVLTPGGEGAPKAEGALAKAMDETFGSSDTFKEEFASAAATRFGSGWAWLIVNKNGGLEVTTTPNQDNPLMDVADVQGTPILGLDVWEHAYYLRYQNMRPDYIKAFWNVVNWEAAEENYNNA
jgi:superoxide dismutase, Fe-Mn family